MRRYWKYLIGLVVVALLLAIAAFAGHKYNYKFTYISPQRALMQCYNGQRPDVQWLDNVMVVECDGE